MRTRTITAILLALAISVAVTALWGAQGDERDGDTATNVVASAGAEAGTAHGDAQTQKKGNRFTRLLKAPWKAVGRLFGAGSDDGKLTRMTERDAARFESVGVMRVEEHAGERPEVTGSEGSARDSLERGRALLRQGDLNGAIAELSRAASLDPRLSEAHSLLAVAFDRKGLHEQAKKSYERAIAANESDAQALNNLGYSLYLSGNYRAAVDRLKRAARLAPDDARVLNNLGLAQCRLGKYEDAYRSFARADGEFQGHANVAMLLERLGREDEAVRHYEAAHRLQPAAPDVLRRLADLYQRTNQPDKAESVRRELETAEKTVTGDK